MHKCKLLLLIFILTLFQILVGYTSLQSESTIKAEKGILNLAQRDFDKELVRLDGEWEFYWNQILEPKELDKGELTGFIEIPSSWNQYITNEKRNSGNGYATYKLTYAATKNERLGLKIPRVFTSYKLWVNGELIASAGIVGKTRDSMTPQYLPQIAFFESQQGENEIVINVSNFYHRSGGILESISLGNEKEILSLRYKGIASALFLFGSLISIGAYHLALFIFGQKNRSSLYFGLFCIMIGIRTLLVGEIFLIYLFPNFNWGIAHKMQTLTFYLGVPLILMFFKTVFPKYFHIRIIRMAQIIGLAFGLLVTFTPARIFTLGNPIYQIWTLFIILYVIIEFIKISINMEKSSLLIIVGALVFLLTSINDIIFSSILKNDNGPALLRNLFIKGNLSSLGQFIFAVTNSLLLAKRFSDSLADKEVVTAKLTEINTNLDELVFKRTKDLEESYEKIEQQKIELEVANKALQQLTLKDPLTGIWNRRKYDETLKKEWYRCLRYQRPISLLLLDIDNFKNFNDTYGHMAGDECLVKIANTLNSSLLRSTDMVARYGGEEFVVLLSETGKEEAINIAYSIRQKIEELRIPHSESFANNYVTMSIGVTSMIPSIDSSYEDLFNIVDKALYEAKNAGKNQVRYLPE